MNSLGSSSRLPATRSISLASISRLALAISQLPSIRLAMPTPEPPPETWTHRVGIGGVVVFRPGLGHVDHRVGAFHANALVRGAATG